MCVCAVGCRHVASLEFSQLSAEIIPHTDLLFESARYLRLLLVYVGGRAEHRSGERVRGGCARLGDAENKHLDLIGEL